MPLCYGKGVTFMRVGHDPRTGLIMTHDTTRDGNGALWVRTAHGQVTLRSWHDSERRVWLMLHGRAA